MVLSVFSSHLFYSFFLGGVFCSKTDPGGSCLIFSMTELPMCSF